MMTISLPNRRRQQGLCYLCFETLLLPGILQALNNALPSPLRTGALNFLFFAINFIAVILIFRDFLLQNLLRAWQHKKRCLITAAAALCVYGALSALVSFLISLALPDFSNVNDESIRQTLNESFWLMSIGTVLLVPITEECLFRGAIFRGLYNRSPVLAWVISVAAFCLVHIFGYIGAYDSLTLAVCFLQYIPAGLCLASAYRISGSILTPVLVHTAVNIIAIITLR